MERHRLALGFEDGALNDERARLPDGVVQLLNRGIRIIL
jgi:hypothetical protein